MLPKNTTYTFIQAYTFISFQQKVPPIRLFPPILLLIFREISHLYFYSDSSSIRNSRVLWKIFAKSSKEILARCNLFYLSWCICWNNWHTVTYGCKHIKIMLSSNVFYSLGNWFITYKIYWKPYSLFMYLQAMSKEVQIVYRLFPVNCYLLHVPSLTSQPAGSEGGWVIDFIWLELPWQYIALTRNNLSIIWISLGHST